MTDASAGHGGRRGEVSGGAPAPPEIAAAISDYGDLAARKLRRIGRDEDVVPEQEEQIREPIAALLTRAGRRLGQDVLLYGEVRLKKLRARPDFGVDVAGRQAGFLEIKAPGRGVPPNIRHVSLNEKRQWESLKVLPNLVYTDGTTWAHYTYGMQDAIAVLEGDLYTAGPRLRAADGDFMKVVEKLLFGAPPAQESLKGVVGTAARLCRLMRDEVREIIKKEGADPERRRQFSRLANDWQGMLFPNLRLEDFPDAYAQTVTFAMLLACASGVTFEDKSIGEISDQLAKHHPLMGRALFVLTRPAAEQELTVPEVLRSVLAPVRWETLKGSKTPYWVMYEDFLREYDPALQRETGSYYTPDLVARFMVEFTDQVLKNSMHLPRGFASEEVTTVDPAMGTGTFLVEILRCAATTIAAEQSEEARPPYLRDMYRHRLIGLERQAAPYAVAELRMHQALKSYKTEVPESSSRYLADTLDDPNARVLDYPELFEDFRDSREGANRVKLDTRVMAVITNPPWRERAAKREPAEWITRPREAGKPADMSRPSLDDFRRDDDLAFKLANQYVYFWRWATWKAFDAHPDHPKGIVAFITPSAYLTSRAFSGMRRYLRRTADEGWIINLSPEGHRPKTGTRIFPTVQHRICIAVFARYGQPRPGEQARVRYTEAVGTSAEKIAALTTGSIRPDGPQWELCRDGWSDPFIPMSDEWLALPDLGDLLPWQHSGIKPNRAWVYAPDSQTLRRRWNKLIAAPASQKDHLLKTSRDRDSNTRPPGDPAVPGNPVPLSLQEPGAPRIERVAFRSFDRQFLILDQRVVDYPRSELWAVADGPQIFLTTSHDQQIRSGPALTFSTHVPDTHHFEGRGGQVIPLYRDTRNRRPNLAPGLAHCLSGRLGVLITPEDLFAYIAAVAAHPGYTRRFSLDLRVPGVHIPLTASSALWREGVSLGRHVLQAHTYGRALHNPQVGRPPEPPRLPPGRRPNVKASPTTLPAKVTYEPHAQEIRFGDGVIAQVPPAAWNYSVGDMNVIRKWFEYRLQSSRHAGPSSAPDVKRSPLDSDRAPEWGPQFADDLHDLLHVIGILIDLEPAQDALLDAIASTPIITVNDLEASGVLPVPEVLRRPPGIRTAPSLIATSDD